MSYRWRGRTLQQIELGKSSKSEYQNGRRLAPSPWLDGLRGCSLVVRIEDIQAGNDEKYNATTITPMPLA
jgi:hypothetical protein